MTLRDLRNTEMVILTRSWVDPSHGDHQVLRARPMMAGFLPEVTAAHQSVLGTLPDPDAAKRLDEIRGEQGQLDDRHDDMPQGLQMVWASYREEADPDIGSDIDLDGETEIANVMGPITV